jgi:endonuclease/exonuclease/phosphatase family metal-dependent hydrolase
MDNEIKIKLATWNIRTMLQVGKMMEIAEELLRYEIDITAIQEVRWKGSGEINKQHYTVYYSGAEKQGAHGVGFIITKKMKNCCMGFEPINERICKLRLRGKFYNLTLISAYAPTEEAQDEVKEQFYEELNIVLEQVSKHDAVIVMGDFNAKVGKEKSNGLVAGKYTLHNETNDNGLRLCQLAEMNNLLISSTKYEHKKIHMGTWKDPANKIVNQIDHILICKRRASTIQDVRTLRGPNCDSDHYLVRAIIKQKITTNYEKRQQKQRWNTSRLNDREVLQKYQEKIEKQMDNIEVKTEVNEEWANIQTIIVNAAKEIIGTQKKERNEWFDEECKEAILQKNKARNKCLTRNIRTNREDYEQKRREARNLFKKKKRDLLRKKMEEIREYKDKKLTRKFYKGIKEINRPYQAKSVVIKDEHGKLIAEQEEILKRWKQYFEDLLKTEEKTTEVMEQDKDEENDAEGGKQEIYEPTIEEIRDIIKSMKNGKAPGTDAITVELIKNAGGKLERRIYNLIRKIWQSEQMPKEWEEGIIFPIYKKGDRRICSNYRGITLLNVTYKIFTSLLHNRLQKIAEREIGDYQAGFRANRSTIDHIHTLRQIMEKSHEYKIELNELFIDFRQAFDTVQRNGMIETLKLMEIPNKLVRLIKMTMENTRATVETEHGRTEKFSINTGLRQGDALSTLLFNLVLEGIIRKLDTRGNISTKLTQICAYADDLVIIARTPKALEEMYLTLEAKARCAGLIVNQVKTKYMKTAREKEKTMQQHIIGQKRFERVNEFIYLGTQINTQNKISEEIRKRIQAGNRCYYANKNIWQVSSCIDISNEKFIVACFSLRDVRCRTEACWRIEQTLCNLMFDCMELSRLVGQLVI